MTVATQLVAAPRRGLTRKLLIAVASVPAGLLLMLVLLIVLLAGGQALRQQQCGLGSPLPAGFSGPGSLGGVAGTGLTPAQLRTVRTHPLGGERVVPGVFDSTAYGPPWGGLQGEGEATAGGVVINGGAPRYYMIAVDPTLVALGSLVYAWPNPFGWKGPFLAADTGGWILGRRVDFYDWRGRATQLRWGRKQVTISARPIKPGGPDVTAVAPVAACDTLAASGPLGRRIGVIARAHLGAGPSIAGFEPPSISVAWCAWFATNVWREAGVPIVTSAASFWPYTWAEPRGLLFKKVGERPRSVTPPAGAALMYGSGPSSTVTSAHVNLVDAVLDDGSFMVTGGNQDTSRVTRYGPCRLSRTDPAYLSGPGCDSRPIYGIAVAAGAGA
jgi:3D (Asp-Asp-Asp) domain-containing protein